MRKVGHEISLNLITSTKIKRKKKNQTEVEQTQTQRMKSPAVIKTKQAVRLAKTESNVDILSSYETSELLSTFWLWLVNIQVLSPRDVRFVL